MWSRKSGSRQGMRRVLRDGNRIPLICRQAGALVGTVVNGELGDRTHHSLMRVAMAAIVALLFLNFVDEHFNNARYTRAAISMAERVIRSFG